MIVRHWRDSVQTKNGMNWGDALYARICGIHGTLLEWFDFHPYYIKSMFPW